MSKSLTLKRDSSKNFDGTDSIDNHPIIRRFILYYSKIKETKLWYENLFQTLKYAVIISPFATISISRQLSVLPHKEIYGDYVPPNKADSKELMKMENQVTIRDSKNFELIKSAGLLEGQKPYRAPIYENYFETIKGLYRQGMLGFYKGTFWRFFFILIPLRIRLILDFHIKDHYPNFYNYSYLKDFIIFSIADWICQPAFITENRYVLQNRLPQFQAYSNILKIRFRSFHEIWVGGSNHIYKNFMFILGSFIFNNTIFPDNYIACMVVSQTFCYPILTCQRRLACQTSEVPGMLPLRYLNLLHALALIKKEEGLFRGLYRGFSFHLIFIYLWYDLVFTSAKISHVKNRLKEEEDLFINDPIFEEIKRRKLRELIQ